jgi:RHS repeat-associated protein
VRLLHNIDINNSKTITDFRQDYPFIGMVKESRDYIDSELLAKTVPEYEYSLKNNIYQIKNTKQTDYTYENNSLSTTSTIENSEYDNYGNIGKVISKVVDHHKNETFTKTTTNTYENDESKWILARLTNASVKSEAYDDIKTKTSSFTYDEDTGILLSETIEPNHEKALTKTYTYGKYGNKISETISANGIESRTTTYAYDSLGKFQTDIKNPLGHTESRTYNADGQLLSLTGPNGRTTTWKYDKFGKKIKENRDDGTTTIYDYSYTSTAGALYSITIQSSGIQPSTTFYNKLGQKILETKVGFDGKIIFVETYYDDLGRVNKISNPFTTEHSPLYTYITYDKYGRVIKRDMPAPNSLRSVETYSYNTQNSSVTTTNELDQTKTETKNAMGKVVRIDEEEGAYQEYKYNANGQLIKTIDSKGMEIVLDYDIFGNKIYQNDPDMGEWSYEYNALGQLIKQTDAKGQTTTMEYDLLGRKVKQTQSEGETLWVFDKTKNGIGKLAFSQKENYKQEFYYDNFGRVIENKEYIDKLLFITEYKYDEIGRVKETISPDGFITINEYNQYGYLEAVKTPKNVSSPYTLDELKEIVDTNLQKAFSYAQQSVEYSNDALKKQAQAKLFESLASKMNGIQKEQLLNTADLSEQMANLLIISANDALEESNKATATINYYLKQASRFQDKELFQYMSEKFREQTKFFLSLAYENLDNVTAHVNQLLDNSYDEEYVQEKQTLIDGYLEQTKDLVLLAQSLSQKMQNYKIKHKDSIDAIETKENSIYLDLVQDDDYQYFYKVLKTDAFGRVTKDIVGNGLITNKTYEQSNGQLKRITTGYNSTNDVRDMEYTYNQLNNVTNFKDSIQNIEASYTYDNLNRVKQASIQGEEIFVDLDYEYDSIGNMIYKSDIGNYEYNSNTHQVNRAGTHSYQYDPNGNMIQKDSTTLGYTSYNKVNEIVKNGKTTKFFYNSNRARYKKTINENDTTYYSGKLFEKQIKDTKVYYKNFIYANNSLIGIHVEEDDGSLLIPTIQYLHKDALGSIDTITNEDGVVIQRVTHKPFGERIIGNWKNQLENSQALTKRGYTGHEHINDTEFIHMNGRVYDAVSARFTSADPNIDGMYTTQGFNRYSYVKNNPLNYTDPSGYWSVRKAFKRVARSVKKVAKSIKKHAKTIATIAVAVAITYFSGGLASGLAGAMISGALAGGGAAIVGAKLNGASWSQAFKAGVKGAVIGAVAAGAAYGVAEGTASYFGAKPATAHASSFLNGTGGYGMAAFKAVAHGISRAAIAKAQGNSSRNAFISGFMSSGFAAPKSWGFFGGTMATAAVSGTVSEQTGGKFANGAMTGAFIHMFNALGDSWSNEDHVRAKANENAILKTTPNQNIHSGLNTWKCEDSIMCSVAKGGWDFSSDAGDVGDLVDAKFNVYDVAKSVGKIIMVPIGMVKGGYDYYQRQQNQGDK